MSHPEIEAVLRGESRWCVIEGDCLDVLREMSSASVVAIVTDPPYSRTSDAASIIGRTQRAVPETQFFEAWLREHVEQWFRLVNPRGAIWLTLDWRGCVSFDAVSARSGFAKSPSLGVWDKKRIGLGGVMRRRYETFLVQPHNEYDVETTGDPDVWEYVWGGGKSLEHPAEKPVEMMRRAIELCVRGPKSEVLILDPFCGSGTTGVAAVQLGYRFIGIEREPSYCAIARRRIADAAAQGSLFDGEAA